MNVDDLFEGKAQLNEVDWFDRSPLTPVLERNRGRWIHFSRTPKLGINPQKVHSDPHGVYFYPIDWILNKPERVSRGEQYALDLPYYFIVDIDLSSPGIHLQKITWADVERLANQNGWFDLFKDEQHHGFPFLRRMDDKDIPGHLMWRLLKYLNGNNTMTWNKALKGVSYVIDTKGVIFFEEPQQCLVLDPRIIRPVESGNNTNTSRRKLNDGDPVVWRRPLMTILQELQKEYGGSIRWQEEKSERPYIKGKKPRAPAMPLLNMEIGDKKISIYGSYRRSYGFSIGIHYVFGREVFKDVVVRQKDMENDIPAIVSMVGEKIDAVMQLESDLRFTPFMNEDETKNFLETVSNAPLHTDFEIDNGYKTIFSTSKHQFAIKTNIFNTSITMRVSDEDFSINAYIKYKNKNFLYASPSGGFTNKNEAAEALISSVVSGIESLANRFGPSSVSYPKIYDGEWDQFVGWLVMNCGLSFNGKLEQMFADQIAKYQSGNESDREYLHRQVIEVMERL